MNAEWEAVNFVRYRGGLVQIVNAEWPRRIRIAEEVVQWVEPCYLWKGEGGFELADDMGRRALYEIVGEERGIYDCVFRSGT